METVSIKKLYNQFKKCPDNEGLSYTYFKYFLMKRLEKAKAPGKSLGFVFDPGIGRGYLQLSVSAFSILEAMKISQGEFIERYKKRTRNYPGILNE